MFESSKEENLLMNKKITNQIEEIDRLQQENKSLKVKKDPGLSADRAGRCRPGIRFAACTHCLAQLRFCRPLIGI